VKFLYYKERVLAKTDGTNIHEVSNLLCKLHGFLMFEEESYCFKCKNTRNELECLNCNLCKTKIEEFTKKIKILTGVSW
jgi:hypothetical protein